MEKQQEDFSKQYIEDRLQSLFSANEKLLKRDKIFLFLSRVVVLISIVGLCLSVLYLYRSDKRPMVEKVAIKNCLSEIIKRGAPLDVVKRVYEDRSYTEQTISFKKKNEYYSDNTPLSTILNDLLVDYYSFDQNETDSTYFCNLSLIIQENRYQNPFDILEDSQSRLFKNLRYKIGDDYDVVEDDVHQIVTELNHKNQLVSLYLNKSDNSFRISIIALIATCLLSLYQIYQGHRTNKKLEEKEKEKEEQSKEKKNE